MGLKELMNTAYSRVEDVDDKIDDLRRRKQESLEIFDVFKKVCDKHNIVYMMGGGSALGAVRHQGFIPWDDDIDINMPRSDYEKFKTVSYELGDDFVFCSPNHKHTATTRFGKIYICDRDGKNEFVKNTCIDIFVIENLPKNKTIRFCKGLISSLGMGMASVSEFYKHRTVSIKKHLCVTLRGCIAYYIRIITGFFLSFIPIVHLYDFADLCNQYRRDTGISGVPSGRKHYFGEQFPSEVYLPVRYGLFEGRKVPLENDVEKYLTNLYGIDYMEIPPENKRERHFR